MTTAAGNKQNAFLTTALTLMLIGMTLILIVVSASTMKMILPTKLAWQFSRTTAIIGYLLLSVSMIWGLVLSSKITKELTPAPAVLVIHNAISWAALCLAAIHPVSLLFDNYYTYNIFHLLIPFIGPYRPLWVGLGVIALYGLLLTTLSFKWKTKIGHKAWKRIHLLTFPTYVLVTIHGLMAGTDSPITVVMYGLSFAAVLFLTNYRLLSARKSRSRK